MAKLFSLFVLLAAAFPGGGFLGVFLADRDGPTVTNVIEGTPAEKAGIEVGDVFLKVADKATPDIDAFLGELGNYDAGAKVRLTLRRGDETMNKVVRLGDRPDDLPTEMAVEADEEPEAGEARALRPSRRVAVVGEAPTASAPAKQPYVGVRIDETEDGLRIAEVVEGGPASAAGLQDGDTLMALGRTENLESMDALVSALRVLKPDQTVRVRVVRDGQIETLSLTLGARDGDGGAAEEPESSDADDEGDDDADDDDEGDDDDAEGGEHHGGEQREHGGDGDLGRLRSELQALRREIRELKELVRKMERGR
ncbi:MAG: PDZ domain-containing protein [Planctomycetota bacterium]